jgi:hypothetical protein
VVLVVAEELNWIELASVLSSDCGDKVRMGVGGLYRLQDLNRSLADAEFALRLPDLTTGGPVVSSMISASGACWHARTLMTYRTL